MPDDSEAPIQLQYNTTTTPWYQRRWLRRWTAVFFACVSLAVLVAPYAKSIWMRIDMLIHQRHIALFGEWKFNYARFHFEEKPDYFGFNGTYNMHHFALGLGYHF